MMKKLKLCKQLGIENVNKDITVLFPKKRRDSVTGLSNIE
jgi:hypothetical protein